jgi:branched-chain amino acid aminotransferase
MENYSNGPTGLSSLIAIDGERCDEVTAKISVLDRGFLYGDSIYEVIRTYDGQPFLLAQHLRRLEHSSELLGIPLPVSLTHLEKEIRDLVRVAPHPDSYIRIIVTRGVGPITLDPSLAIHPCRVLIVTPLPLLPETLYTDGAAIVLVSAGRAAAGAVPAGAKSGNYLVNIMALRTARERGAHEAILLDAQGRVTEGCSSNIFILTAGQLCTPPLAAGILEGITRGQIMTLAQQGGWEVQEKELWPQDLQRAEEVFLTSTLREVLAVTRVDDHLVGRGCPGPVAQELRRRFVLLTRQPEEH